MPSLPKRSHRFVDRERLLAAMGDCRETITRELARIEISGPLYSLSSTVLAAIDGLALMLTGRARALPSGRPRGA